MRVEMSGNRFVTVCLALRFARLLAMAERARKQPRIATFLRACADRAQGEGEFYQGAPGGRLR